MKFIVNSQVLNKKIKSLIPLTGSGKSTLPILSYLLFNLEDKSLKITASDQETTISVMLSLQEDGENGSVCVPGKLLKDLLDNLSDMPIGFTISETDNHIDITAGKGRYSFAGENAELFPVLVSEDEAKTYTINPDIISQGIQKTLYATSDNTLRPIMMGVHFEFEQSGASFIGTDAHKLVRMTRNDWSTDQPATFTIHKKALSLVRDIISEYDDTDMTVKLTEKNVCFSFLDATIYCRLVEGDFPNYRAIIPNNNDNVLIADTAQIKTSIKRVASFSTKATQQIYFKIQGQEMLVNAEDTDFATKAQDSIPCSYDGVPIDISFSAKFLLDMLGIIESKEVKIVLSAPTEPNSLSTRPGLIFPTEQDSNEDLLILVMPMQNL